MKPMYAFGIFINRLSDGRGVVIVNVDLQPHKFQVNHHTHTDTHKNYIRNVNYVCAMVFEHSTIGIDREYLPKSHVEVNRLAITNQNKN